MLNAVQQNADVMQDLFVYTAVPLDATVVEHLLSVTHWPEAGSNRFLAEKRTQTQWQDFMQDMQSNMHW